MKTSVRKEKIVIPTYPVGDPEPLPSILKNVPIRGAKRQGLSDSVHVRHRI